VADAIKRVRSDVVWLEDLFPDVTKDPVWLQQAGENRWLVICRDKKVRTRPGELAAIRDYGVGCFYLTQKRDGTRWEYLKLLALTLDEMVRVYASTARPFIFGVSREGQFRRVV